MAARLPGPLPKLFQSSVTYLTSFQISCLRR